MFTYTLVYAGPDGESHFGDVAIDTVPTEVFPGLPRLDVASPIATTSLTFVGFPMESLVAGWRRPPRRQFVIFGADAEVEVSDGEVRRIRAGNPVLFEDTTGKGHATRLLAEGETLAVFLPLPD
ncbi:MAG TPA: hypothetical protein VFE42_18130 [Chloroflexota bacterium]|nr:hypothetical protein [Chloroflexota bacterium]